MKRELDIGLLIAGVKGGFRVFCYNSVVDRRIMDRILSYNREFLKLSKPFQTSYSLEITETFKVFTVYRSCSDNGNGAYIQITALIPHGIKVLYIRCLLDEMIDLYFKEFIHPIFGTYLENKYDSIDMIEQCIDDQKIMCESRFMHFNPSILSDCYGLVLYGNGEEIDLHFECPYQKEFAVFQKIYFMNNQMYNDILDKNKVFLSKFHILNIGV